MYLVLVCCLLLGTSVEAGKLVGEESTYGRDQGFNQYLYYVAAGNGAGQVEYHCVADPGTTTSQAKWQIRKFIYNSSNLVSEIHWAEGTDAFDKICSNYSTYSYP